MTIFENEYGLFWFLLIKSSNFNLGETSGAALQSPAVITECSQTLSTSTTASSPQGEEMITEYITLVGFS